MITQIRYMAILRQLTGFALIAAGCCAGIFILMAGMAVFSDLLLPLIEEAPSLSVSIGLLAYTIGCFVTSALVAVIIGRHAKRFL